ncbi:MAG TPA: TonB-dependent receptor [Steroidobacteraceae bacterium]
MKNKVVSVAVAVSAIMAMEAVHEVRAPVHAQAATDLEEVIVTARKRDETFRDVPVTVDVLTEQTIKDAGIDSTRDFVAMIPNVTLVETQNAGNSFITVRGISQARNSEPSVAVLVDGVLESNPYEFDQELFDVRQIEVLKGPQGALYGRNAIGGAIIIRTKDPSDQFEGTARVGLGNGTSERAQVALSGPIDAAGTLKYRASLNFYNTDGYLDNAYLGQKADPVRDYSGRLRLLWKASDAITGDFRAYVDHLETRAYYFVIPRDNEANPFASFTTAPNANDVTSPIQVNNPGEDNRDIRDLVAKFDFDTGAGTITSITNYDRTKEIDTGDAFDFRPRATSIFQALLGTDLNQSQFIDVQAWSQELRFTSPQMGAFSWIGGAYFVHTERFISTGNMVDEGLGVFPVYEQPRLTGVNPSATFLADSQNNNAWAVFGDATYELSKQWELDGALRYDEDSRQNRTDTPPSFLALLGDPTAVSGEIRKHTWSELQPKGTIRYKPSDDITFYGGWSRGFRSGGFNQTGVGAAARNSAPPVLGVNDLFNAEVADTWEVGVKGQFLDRRLNAGLSLYRTKSTNGYFFVFLAANSTQNLGNLSANYKGAELQLSARPTDRLDVYVNFGYTDSEITAMADPTVIGNQAPLVSKTTFNAGIQYKQPLQGSLNGLIRLDYQNIGRTWWEPYNLTSRDPVNLLDLRAGVEGDKWSVMAWSKNLTNEKYNAEFSPGGFLWRALPRRYGVDLNYRF